MEKCPHLPQIKFYAPATSVCAQCVTQGDTWVHLRMCMICGEVGCCNDSKNKHAQVHFHQTGHPVIRTIEPDEDWVYCLEDQVYLSISPPSTETEHPSQPGQTQQAIINRYLLLSSLYTFSASLIWGVNTLFLLGAGLDIFQVFIANAIFTASMSLFEIPTGVLADTRGRRASFLLSIGVLLLGTLGYVGAAQWGGGLLLFGIMSVILGLGYTFYSGAVEAWLVDALKARGFEGGLDQVFARSAMVSGIAMLAGTVSGGLLGNWNLSVPYLVRAACLGVLLIIAFAGMQDLGFTPRTIKLAEIPGEMKKVIRSSVHFGWREAQVRLLILSGILPSSIITWGFYAWPPYFLELLGRDLPWVAGVIAALTALAMVIGNALVERLTKFCGKRTTLLLWGSGVMAVAFAAVGVVGNFWLAVLFFLIGLGAVGVIQPVAQAYLHQLIASENRATVVSFQSLANNAGSVVSQIGLGYMSQAISIPSGFVTGGLVSLLALPVILLIRGLGKPADRIVGAAGAYGACAAQGLPGVSAVDTMSSAIATD